MLNISVAIIVFFIFSCHFNLQKRGNHCRCVRVFMAEPRDVWSTTHFITSEQIVNWLQGIAASPPRLTQTVNPHLWLAVMMPRKVSRVVTNEVIHGPGHWVEPEKPEMQNKSIRLKINISFPRTEFSSV